VKPQVRQLFSIQTGFGLFLASVSALIFSLAHAGWSVAQEEVSLNVRHAVEVEFQSKHGMVYDLQSSSDNQDWSSIGDLYFGDGARVVDVISYRQTGDRQKFFRVKVLEAKDVGIAPVSIIGYAYLLNDGGDVRLLKFQNGATGTIQLGSEEPESFRYGFVKTGASKGRLKLLIGEDFEEIYEMRFETDEAGAFSGERFDGDELEDTEAGTFSRVQGRIESGFDLGDKGDAEAPANLAGYSFMLSSGGQTSMLKVLNEKVMKESVRNISSSYMYDYTFSGSLGIVSVWKGPAKYDHYQLDFVSASSGTFKRTQYNGGVVRDTDTGLFSVFGVEGLGNPVALGAEGPTIHFPDEIPIEGDTPPDTNDGQDVDDDAVCEIPDGMEGLCVDVRIAGVSERFCFRTGGHGDLIEPMRGTTVYIPFSYDYSKNTERRARLVVKFLTTQGSDRFVFDLTLDGDCSGSFVRSEYKGEKLLSQKAGRFSMRAEQIEPDPQRPGGEIVKGNPNLLDAPAEVIRSRVLKD
jgi:hypothetical protein